MNSEEKSASVESWSWPSGRFPALWDSGRSEFRGLFERAEFPWDVLKFLDVYLNSKLESISGPEIRSSVPDGVHIEGDVFIDEGCVIEEGSYIRGPAWIGAHCEIRSGCYIRGAVLAGEGAVLGHSSEFKHCVLLGLAQAPHFNYVGDSVMGYHAHIGAGVILSNFRLDGKAVPVRALDSKERIDSGLPKFGALIGDGCEIGCNTVLNPGTIVGEKSIVMPLSLVSGTWPRESRIENQALRRPN
jgi:NDP-sugar pyrophosphorylase family protein